MVDGWKPPKLETLFNALKYARRVALDTETYDPDLLSKGPGPRRDGYIVGVSLAVEGGDAWYLPVRHDGGDNMDPSRVFSALRKWSVGYKGEIVGANLMYDLEYLALEKSGPIAFERSVRFLDVQNAEPLIYEHAFSYSLDTLAQKYLGKPKATSMLVPYALAHATTAAQQAAYTKSPQQVIWKMRGRDVAAYAISDAQQPLQILREQEKVLKEEELEYVWNLETRLMPMLLSMRLNGVPIDVPGAEKARAMLVAKRADIQAQLNKLAGHEVNFNIAETFAPVLERAGVVVPLTPKTKKKSLTKDFLDRLQHPHADLYRSGRKIDKAIGTFMDGHILGSHINGRVYPSIHALKNDENGTISGRFSYSSPNLQQMSKRDLFLAPIVRGCFVAEEGEDWLRFDSSQAEYRFLTHYARGPGAEDARQQYINDHKTSFHKLAAQMVGIDPTNDDNYAKVKNTNFCKVYGGGPPKISYTAQISLAEAVAFVETYDRELPFVKNTNEWVARVAASRGYVKSISGRRHRFVLWEPTDWKLSKMVTAKHQPAALEEMHKLVQQALDAPESMGLPKGYRPRRGIRRARTYKALNDVLQGGAADHIKETMVQQWEKGICDVLGPMLLTVHDEEAWSLPRTKIGEEAAKEAHRIMETAITLKVPFLVERQQGPNWGAAK